MKLIRVLHHVPGFMAENAHAFRPGAAFNVEDFLLLQLHQAWMCQKKRERDAGCAVRAEPFAGNPGMWADPQVSLLQLLMERLEAVLEPSAFNFDLEIAETQLEQLLVGQEGPGKFPCRHEISNPDSDLDPLYWAHAAHATRTAPGQPEIAGPKG